MLRLLLILAFVAALAPFAVLVAGLEGAPALPVGRPPAPEDAHRARARFREFRALTDSDAPGRALTLSAEDLDAAAALVTRLAPGLRADFAIDEGGVSATFAYPAPLSGERLWWNLRARAPVSEDGLRLSALSLGRAPLPASLAPESAALALDLVLGGGAGTAARRAIDRVAIEDGALRLGVAMTVAERKDLAARSKALARTLSLSAGADSVRRHLALLTDAIESGPLGPALAAALRVAAEEAERRDPRAELHAALFALATACGERRFELVVAQELSDEAEPAAAACKTVRLNGRADLRQHFVLAAALYAASDAQPAFALGEIKELLDASGGGSGFSFDDLAADRAGIRFATVLLSSAPAEWRRLAALLEEGEALLPALDGLDSGMTAERFARDYGDIDDPRYAALIDEIDRRIAALPLFSAEAAALR